MQTVNFDVIRDVISSGFVSNLTPVDGRVIGSCHGDFQVASILSDPDVLVVVERKARTVTEPDDVRCRNTTYDAVECVRLAGDHYW